MNTAEVAVFGFTLKPVTYSYQIPAQIVVSPGQLVRVPFGTGTRDGIVVSVGKTPQTDRPLKEVISVKSEIPVLSPTQLKLADWLSMTYFISLAEAIRLILPQLPNLSVKPDISIKKHIKQHLILFPTLRQAALAQKTQPGLLFSHGTTTSFKDDWQKISSGSVKTILGARSALFAPFANLEKITIFQTESDLYKEERRPYYRAFDVAIALGKISGTKVTAIGFSPRIQDHYTLAHQIKILPKNFQTQVVDISDQPILRDQIFQILAENVSKKILVFLNRRSEKGPLLCRTCKTRSYVADPSVCPNCGSAQVSFQKFNLQTVSTALSKFHYPNLTLATQQIFFQDTSPFDLILVLSADTYLNQANFDSNERTFRMLTQLLRLLKPAGKMIVQTARPHESSIGLALANDYSSFFKQELKLRREAAYPPFSKIAKITYAQAGTAPDPELSTNLEVFGPFDGQRFQYYVVRGKDLTPLAKLERPWKLDIDPLNL